MTSDVQNALGTAAGPISAVAVALPRIALEAELLRIWEEVLGITPIGAEDNFFDLGGHSLLALEMVARVREALGAPKFPIDLLATQTAAAMADAIIDTLTPHAELARAAGGGAGHG